jgi:hypothetical protein
MNETPMPNQPLAITPAPKKSGCGCCLWGCFATLLVAALMIVGGGMAFWYGMKTLAIPDTAVMWTYEKVIRPKIEETLPPNMNPAQRQQVLKTADFGVKRYMELSPDQKKIILKEALTASYYYSQQQVIPPEKIPNLSKFIQETVQVYKEGP